MARFAVILPAAGNSSRFRDKEKKPFALLDGRAVWLRSAELFITRQDVCQTILVVAPEDMETFRRKFTANIAFMDIKIVEGGAERFESEANALAVLQREGASTNIKITSKGDLFLAEAILKSLPKPKPQAAAHPFADEEQMWGGRKK